MNEICHQDDDQACDVKVPERLHNWITNSTGVVILHLLLTYRGFLEYTCCEANLHVPLSVAQYLELGQRHLVRHADRVGALVPFITDVSHSITNYERNKEGFVQLTDVTD